MLKRILLTCLMLAGLTACNDDDNTPSETLTTPVITISERTSTSIAFTWDAVNGARQYGYRVVGPDGSDVAADVTTERRCECDGLTPFTTYTVSVSAFPTEHGTALASQTTQDIPTLFYDALVDCPTTYVCHLQANASSVTKRGVINEDRSADDYMENTYGVFTISKFYGVEGHDIVFTVNRDNTITILNGERDEESGTVTLTTGLKISSAICLDKIHIDEHSTVFNGPGRTLTFTATNNGTDSKLRVGTEETIAW